MGDFDYTCNYDSYYDPSLSTDDDVGLGEAGDTEFKVRESRHLNWAAQIPPNNSIAHHLHDVSCPIRCIMASS